MLKITFNNIDRLNISTMLIESFQFDYRNLVTSQIQFYQDLDEGSMLIDNDFLSIKSLFNKIEVRYNTLTDLIMQFELNIDDCTLNSLYKDSSIIFEEISTKYKGGIK